MNTPISLFDIKYRMKKVIITCLLIVLLLPLPFPFELKDGGSKEFHALTWSVIKYHRLADEPEQFEVGIGVKICGFEVYKNTHFEKE